MDMAGNRAGSIRGGEKWPQITEEGNGQGEANLIMWA